MVKDVKNVKDVRKSGCQYVSGQDVIMSSFDIVMVSRCQDDGFQKDLKVKVSVGQGCKDWIVVVI